MPVVSTALPILNLATIGRLDLLHQQFGEVLIPPMVLQELKVDAELPGVEPIRLALQNHWLRVFELSNTDIARALRRDLDNGEAEATALALQLKLMTVLIDEHDGRAATKAMGLVPVGVLYSVARQTYGQFGLCCNRQARLAGSSRLLHQSRVVRQSRARGRRTLMPDFVIRPHCSDRRVIFW